MKSRSSPGDRRRTRFEAPLPAVLVFVVALAATIGLTLALTRAMTARSLTRFHYAMQETQDSIRERLEREVDTLGSGAALFSTGASITADGFRAFTERAAVEHGRKGNLGMGYAAWVQGRTPEEIRGTLAAAGATVDRAWPQSAAGNASVIAFLEPQSDRNRAAMGFDMFQEPVRRAAMERARDTGRAAMSGRVTLMQEIDADKQPGFLIYVPVYRGGSVPATVEARRAALAGFVYSPFRAGDLLGGIFNGLSSPRVAFELFDGERPDDGALLYRSAPLPGRAAYQEVTAFSIGGRNLCLRVASLPNFERFSGEPAMGLLLGFAVLLSLLLFFVVRNQVLARSRAERDAEVLAASENALRESERRARRIIEGSIVGIGVVDGDGALVDANEAFLAMTRLARGALGGSEGLWRSVAPVRDEAERLLEEQAAEMLSATGAHPPYERELLRPDGQARRCLVSSAVIGERGLRAVFVLDVTEERSAQAALERESRANATLRRIGASLASELDLGRLLQRLTDEVTDLVGAEKGLFVPVEAKVGAEMHVSGPAADTDFGLRDLALQLRRDVAEPVLVADVRQSGWGDGVGTRPICSFMATPVLSRSGELLGRLCFGHSGCGRFSEAQRDLLEGIAAQASVALDNARLFQEAEEAVKLRDDFLSIASHELKTPLTGMQLHLESALRYMRRQQLEEPHIDEKIRGAMAQVRRLSFLIGELLDVSRITAGRLKLEPEPMDLGEVVTAVAERFALESLRAQAPLLVDVAPGATGLWDRLRVEQVVTNLLSNALKYGARSPVQVSVRVRGGAAELEVCDHGIGIAPEDQARIFDRFERVVSVRHFGGFGLGLWICRQIVESHGGEIRVSSEVGKGSTFVVRLPVTVAQASPSTDIHAA